MSEDKSLVLKLKYPVKIGSMPEVSILNFRRIKGKDLRELDLVNMKMDDILELAEKLTSETTSFFDELDGTDFIAVMEKVGNLLGNSQLTGN